MMVFISNGKTTCFGLYRPSSGFDIFLAKRVLYNITKPRGNVEILSFYVLLLSYIWWDVYWVNEFVGSWVWIFPERSRNMCTQVRPSGWSLTN